MSISGEKLAHLYKAEGLDPPAVMPWPLSGTAEQDRVIREDRFRQRMARKPPPGLDWMASHAAVKYRPDLVLEGCRSVLVSSLRYYRDDPVDHAVPKESGTTGRIARYARGRDYHKELGNRLRRIALSLREDFPGEGFKPFVDIGPLDETWLAEASGAGFIGRHALAIVPKSGSWVVLGHILCSLSTDKAPPRPSPMACPEGCRRCLDACPTGALAIPGKLDASRCISYLTVEASGPTSAALRNATGDRLFGCDACQEACPFNARVLPTEVESFLTDRSGAEWDLSDILALGDREDVVSRFAGSPLMRAGRTGLMRNACTIAGNSGSRKYLPRLKVLLEDDDSGVREHAAWAIGEIDSAVRV